MCEGFTSEDSWERWLIALPHLCQVRFVILCCPVTMAKFVLRFCFAIFMLLPGFLKLDHCPAWQLVTRVKFSDNLVFCTLRTFFHDLLASVPLQKLIMGCVYLNQIICHYILSFWLWDDLNSDVENRMRKACSLTKLILHFVQHNFTYYYTRCVSFVTQ